MDTLGECLSIDVWVADDAQWVSVEWVWLDPNQELVILLPKVLAVPIYMPAFLTCVCLGAGDAQRLPIEWVRLDPHGELLAATHVAQPEFMLAAQLERSKDVVAQSAAVAGLAAARPITYGVVNALRACVLNGAIYCRCAAAAAPLAVCAFKSLFSAITEWL